MNRSKQTVVEIFHQLNSRLKSADEKNQSEVKGQVGEDAQKKRDEDGPPDNQTSSITITVYVQ